MVKKCEIVRRRKRPDEKITGKRRNRSFNHDLFNHTYYLQKPGEAALTEVCTVFFLNTLVISRKQMRTALSKENDIGGIEMDKRGYNVDHNKLTDECVNQIVDHICKFLTVESHYVIKGLKKQYLPSTLSIAEMHRMYI